MGHDLRLFEVDVEYAACKNVMPNGPVIANIDGLLVLCELE